MLFVLPLRIIKKTSPHVIRTWSKTTKTNRNIFGGFKSGHKSWDGTTFWIWWTMIPQHWQHTLSHQGHINHETQPVQAASLPLVTWEKIQWDMCFLKLSVCIQCKGIEREEWLSALLFYLIFFLFFFFSNLNIVHFIWQLFLHTQNVIFFFLCIVKVIGVLAY